MDRTLTAPALMTSKATDPDLSLVERYADGDMGAFDELMIRYERQIYRLCYGLLVVTALKLLWDGASGYLV